MHNPPYHQRSNVRLNVSNIKRRIAVFLAALLVAGIGASIVAASPAAAGSGLCPGGYTCFWENIGYSGSGLWYSSGFRGQCVNVPGNWHDRVSSVDNEIGADFVMYSDANCSGSQIWGWNGFTIGDMRSWGFNDAMDSVYFYP